jgi:hypothetical protein
MDLRHHVSGPAAARQVSHIAAIALGITAPEAERAGSQPAAPVGPN